MNDLQNMLPDYFYVGVGREDGDKKGEFSAIFFRKNKHRIDKKKRLTFIIFIN